MNELQLVGYTADLKYLVFSDVNGAARHKVPVDEDLVATLSEVLTLVEPDREPFPRSAVATAAAADETEAWPTRPSPSERADSEQPRGAEPRRGAESAATTAGADRGRARRVSDDAVVPGRGGLAAFVVFDDPGDSGNGAAAEPEARASSRLSPREIQALLRAGMAPRSVAKRAETDEAWVNRWLPPIEAERRQVLEALNGARIEKARLGPSRDPLGEAVRKNLAEKGLRDDSDEVEWQAARREGDSHWVVTLRYRSRGRLQRAVWHFDPETGELEARNTLATDVAWTRPRGRKTARPAARKPAAKKPTGKKSAARKPAAKKSAAKKAAAKKPAAKKPAAKKSAAKKSAAKQAAAKKPPVKQAAAKKAGAGTSARVAAKRPGTARS